MGVKKACTKLALQPSFRNRKEHGNYCLRVNVMSINTQKQKVMTRVSFLLQTSGYEASTKQKHSSNFIETCYKINRLLNFKKTYDRLVKITNALKLRAKAH